MEHLVKQLRDMARGMWHRRWYGLAVAWLVGAVGALVVYSIPDRYEASARVYVDTDSVLRPLMTGIAVQRNLAEELSILSRILISRPNVEKLVRMTDSDLGIKSPQEREKLIDRMMSSLQIRAARREDNLYTISYRDTNPEQAKRVVQALLSIFLESSLGNKRSDAEQAEKFINEQIAIYEKRLQDAENRLKEFRLKYMGLGAGGDRDYISQLTALSEELARARVELRAAEESRDALKRELAGEEPVFLPDAGAAAPAETGAVPEIDARLATLKQALDELLRRYTDRHPDVQNTRRIIAELEQEKQKILAARRASGGGPATMGSADRNPVYQQIKVSLAAAEANVAALRARVANYEARYRQLQERQALIPQMEAELARLNRDYEVEKRAYENLVARREQAAMSKELQGSGGIGEFRVIDPPRAESKPVAPNRSLLLPVVFAGSLGAGLLASFLVSQLFPTFHDSRTLREVTRRPVLGTISLLPSPALNRQRRRRIGAFAAGLAGLVACYAVGILFTLTKTPLL